MRAALVFERDLKALVRRKCSEQPSEVLIERLRVEIRAPPVGPGLPGDAGRAAEQVSLAESHTETQVQRNVLGSNFVLA